MPSVWALRPGEEHNFIDGRTHVHHLHLFNQVTGGEHNIDVLLHAAKCRVCGRPFPNLADGDTSATVASKILEELQILEENHARLMAYAAKVGVPIRLGALASHVPHGHSVVTLNSGGKLLRVPRIK